MLPLKYQDCGRPMPLKSGEIPIAARKSASYCDAMSASSTERRPPGADATASSRADRILQLSFALAAASTPAEVSDAVMSGTRVAFPDSVGAIIARLASTGEELEIFAVSELPGEVFENWQRFPVETDAPLAEVFRTGDVIALESPKQWEARYPHLMPLLDQTGHRAQILAPLVVGGVIVGSLGVAFDKPRSFSTDDVHIITAIASQCAVALERVRLFDREREARAAAEDANRTKSEFMASLSHELRTPMNAIGGYVQLLELGVHGPITEAQAGALHRIQGIQRHVNGLIESVLEFSRIEAGVVLYDNKPVDLEACLRECESFTAPQIREHDLAYERHGSAGHLPLVADEEKLRQILVNLLTNAIKYNSTRGRIMVTVESDDRRIYVRVSDTGRGIDSEKLDLIFQPFVQLVSGGSIKHGVGLGLPISRSLARGMGGDLTAECNPGGGSTFVLSLPQADG
jgi:signal transduction histidine kinase